MEFVVILVALAALVALYIVTRVLIAKKLGQAARRIITDLRKQDATSPVTAVRLPYAEGSPLRIGMRDYQAEALRFLIMEGTVGKTSTGSYYLMKTSRTDENGPHGR